MSHMSPTNSHTRTQRGTTGRGNAKWPKNCAEFPPPLSIFGTLFSLLLSMLLNKGIVVAEGCYERIKKHLVSARLYSYFGLFLGPCDCHFLKRWKRLCVSLVERWDFASPLFLFFYFFRIQMTVKVDVKGIAFSCPLHVCAFLRSSFHIELPKYGNTNNTHIFRAQCYRLLFIWSYTRGY